MTYWKLVSKIDVRARLMADRHYSRQHPGAREFCPPGNNIVLLGLNDDAVWVSHRPDPKADLEKRRADGFDYWDNPIFRREHSCPVLASELIRQALAITVGLWDDVEPPDGFHSFVNPRKVSPTMVRGRAVYGWCFVKAGFQLWPEVTKSRGLLRYVYPLAQLRTLEALEPAHEQARMWA